MRSRPGAWKLRLLSSHDGASSKRTGVVTSLAGLTERALMDVVEPVAAIAGGLQDEFGDILDRVAGVTVEPLVGPGQRVFGLTRMVEAPARPSIGIVAKCAIGPQAPLVKLVLVATAAGGAHVLVGGRAMTLLARHDRMASNQWKVRQVMIECDGLMPARVPMALFAAGAELTLVSVVLLVAGHAGGRQLVAIEVARVAGVAFDRGVAAAQRKLRLVVVENHGLPQILVVTVFAFRAVTARMYVLYAVTPTTRGGDVGVALAGMACRAIDLPMRAAQRKFGGLVIECLDVQPGIVAMALLALLPELTLVRVGRLVTIKAKPRSVAKLHLLGMAIAAGCGLVCALQAEIGQRMVERLAIEQNDIGAPPLVIGVTQAALLFGGIELAPMKSPARPAVGADLLVTIQTLACLRLP